MARYANVKFDRETGKIVGENVRNEWFTLKFVEDIKLFAINLAIDMDIMSIRVFLSLADGPREEFSSSGYDCPAHSSRHDWREIRESSDEAKEEMFIVARRILKQHRSRLSEIGLPDDLIDVLVDAY